eukprot:759374-Hanusia_phi.AAC.2
MAGWGVSIEGNGCCSELNRLEMVGVFPIKTGVEEGFVVSRGKKEREKGRGVIECKGGGAKGKDEPERVVPLVVTGFLFPALRCCLRSPRNEQQRVRASRLRFSSPRLFVSLLSSPLLTLLHQPPSSLTPLSPQDASSRPLSPCPFSST